MARAWHRAGASNDVMTLWNVDDEGVVGETKGYKVMAGSVIEMEIVNPTE
jgi:hypothetical protein